MRSPMNAHSRTITCCPAYAATSLRNSTASKKPKRSSSAPPLLHATLANEIYYSTALENASRLYTAAKFAFLIAQAKPYPFPPTDGCIHSPHLIVDSNHKTPC